MQTGDTEMLYSTEVIAELNKSSSVVVDRLLRASCEKILNGYVTSYYKSTGIFTVFYIVEAPNRKAAAGSRAEQLRVYYNTIDRYNKEDGRVQNNCLG